MSSMSAKERLLSALTGQETDRTPWSPFLAYYWEHQPQEIQQMGQVAYLKQIGADPLLRGFHQLFEIRYQNCGLHSTTRNGQRCDTYETKHGTLKEVYTWSSTANSWFLTEHPVKTEGDFRVLQDLYEDLDVLPHLDDFERDFRNLGDDGLYLPVLGTNMKTSFQSLVEHWCGTVDLTYALYDFPEIVEECLSVMRAKDRETVLLSLNSSAEGFIFWEDSSTTNISPDFFARYTAPQINEWGSILHSENRLLIHHACGHLQQLLPLMAQTEIDMVESVSPPPTGNIDIKDAFTLLPENIGIIGGIEPTFFERCTLRELEAYVRELLHTASGKRFVLSNSDSCPPGVSHEKFIFMKKLIQSIESEHLYG